MSTMDEHYRKAYIQWADAKERLERRRIEMESIKIVCYPIYRDRDGIIRDPKSRIPVKSRLENRENGIPVRSLPIYLQNEIFSIGVKSGSI